MWCTVCRVAFAICALTASGDAALAQALYKCRAADGSLTYQDRECPPDADELVPPAIAPPPRDPYVPKLPDTIAGDADVPLAAPAQRPHRTLPRLWYCEKPEGGSYVSETPDRRPRQVPLWTLDRYSPMFGAGMGASGAFYTTVVDACRPLARDEACAEWRKRLEQAEHDANLAFRDTRDALDARVAELREGLDSNCR